VPLIVPAPNAADPAGFAKGAAVAMAEFRARYRAYFKTNNAKSPVKKIRLDDSPRVVLVPGVGLFGIGSDAKSAHVAADLAETTVDVMTNAEAVGRFDSISKYGQFEIEYWSLEQAKLSKGLENRWRGKWPWSPAPVERSAGQLQPRSRRKAPMWPYWTEMKKRSPRRRQWLVGSR
jgi:hypothetical protein